MSNGLINRQYVGARYVPKIMGEWNKALQYEALSVVTYMGNSFTSKVLVPANSVEINNTDYWVNTGNYNTQVAEYESNVREYKNETDSKINDINTSITTLNNRTDEKHTILLFGDSWADYNSDKANVLIPSYLSRRFNCTVKNYAHGGTGFKVPNGYDEQLDECLSDSSVDFTDVKFIVLVAGLNEYNGTTTASQFRDYLDEWYNLVKTKFTKLPANTKVYWFMDYSLEHNYTTRTNHTGFYEQYEYYTTVANNLYTEIIPNLTFAWFTGDSEHVQTSNWYHLTQLGQRQFANNMCNAISGVPINYHTYYTDKVTENGMTIAYLTYEYANGNLTCTFGATMLSLSTITGSKNYVARRNLPCKLYENSFITDNCYTIAPQDYNTIRVKADNKKTFTSTTDGRIYKKIDCEPI